jgi:hypothetical protein
VSCPQLFEPVDAAHLRICAECRAVQAALAAPSGPVDLARLKGPALAELSAHPRSRPWWLAALGLLAVCAVALGVARVFLPPQTSQHASVLLRQLSSAAWGLTLFTGCVLAVMPGARPARLALLGAVMGCFAITLAAASGVGPSGPGSFNCMLIEWGIAFVPLASALMVITGFAFDATRALCASLATMSAGVLVVHLHCPNGTLLHQALCHLLPILVLMGVGLVLRSRLPSRTHAP